MAGDDTEREREDYPLSEVPLSARRGLLPTTIILLGFTFFSATMWGGGTIGVAFPFWPDLIAVILCGNLLLALYVAALGYVSQKSGLNTVLMARFCFGNLGGRWVDLLLGFTQIGWYAWGTATIAILLTGLLNLDECWQAPLMLFFGFTFCWTAFVGYQGLERLSTVSVPLMCILIFASMWIATRDAGGIAGILSITPTAAMGFGEAVTVVVGTFISGGTQVTNWTRFSDTPKNAVIATLIAFFAGNGLMVFAGAYGAIVYQESDVVQILALQGLLFWGVVMLFAKYLDHAGQHRLQRFGGRVRPLQDRAAATDHARRRRSRHRHCLTRDVQLAHSIYRDPRHLDPTDRGRDRSGLFPEAPGCVSASRRRGGMRLQRRRDRRIYRGVGGRRRRAGHRTDQRDRRRRSDLLGRVPDLLPPSCSARRIVSGIQDR